MIHDAAYFTSLGEGRVRCDLCPAYCRLKDGQRGICRSRFNDEGRLKTDNFGETVTVAIDPIEKKPLYHFYPTTDIISIGPNGCNLSCRHCQNWQISQQESRTVYIAPEQLPDVASQRGSIGVAYTYTEPMIWFEYIREAAPLLRKAGLVNVMVSNGYINPEPLEELIPLIDACNIDLKGMRPEFYTRICKGKLDPVLDVIRRLGQSPAHLEVTNLVIPELNDSDEDFHKLAAFIASVDTSIPIHFSGYYPTYKLDNPPTPGETLQRAYTIAKDYVEYVFVGNMNIDGCSHSYCSGCGNVLLDRAGYRVQIVGLNQNGACSQCGKPSGIVLPKEKGETR